MLLTYQFIWIMAKNSDKKNVDKKVSSMQMLKCQHAFLKSHLKELHQLKEKLSNLKK